MPTPSPTATPLASHRLRAGTAARLAGLPVTTLRVWERRYGVVAAVKSENGQRLYAPHDVARLRLLRQLTRAGHAIGTIAGLELDALQALAGGEPPRAEPDIAPARRAVVVGRSAVEAVRASGCRLDAVHDDLDGAEAAPAGDDGIDVLVVRLASLQPASVDRVLALRRRLCATALHVVYAFGTEASAQALRGAGAAVRREPVGSGELAQWLGRAHAAVPAPPWPVAPRRFDDEALARLADLPSPVACECLRHMGEIVAQLGHFERYSQDCVSTGPDDAELHRRLSDLAGAARTAFERALGSVLAEAGLADSVRQTVPAATAGRP